MARKNTPTSILEFKGAFKKHPERKRVGEPRPTTPLGDPPDRLEGDALKAWFEIERQCHPGVITGMDRAALEVIATSFAYLWNNESASTTERKSVLSMLGLFGMTPSDRANLTVPPPDKPGDYDDF